MKYFVFFIFFYQVFFSAFSQANYNFTYDAKGNLNIGYGVSITCDLYGLTNIGGGGNFSIITLENGLPSIPFSSYFSFSFVSTMTISVSCNTDLITIPNQTDCFPKAIPNIVPLF